MSCLPGVGVSEHPHAGRPGFVYSIFDLAPRSATATQQRPLWRAYDGAARSLSILYVCDLHIGEPVTTDRFARVIGMSFVSELRLRPTPEADTFDQFLAVLWSLSEITFDVFGTFFWTALALLYLKAIG